MHELRPHISANRPGVRPVFNGLIGLIAALAVGLLTHPAAAQQAQHTYKKPPQEVIDILDAPRLPAVTIDPTGRYMLLVKREDLPPVADLAQPMLRLAGSRINPNTNAPHGPRRFVGITIQSIETGRTRDVRLPDDPDVGFPRFSPDGSRFAFTITDDDGVAVWVASTASGLARPVTREPVNAIAAPTFTWLSDSRRMIVSFVPDDRGAPPDAPATPAGPVIQESSGRVSPVRTYQDLLEDPHDEALYDYYFTAQLAIVDTETREREEIGEPAIYSTVSVAPDGEHILTVRRVRPYSYLVPAWMFPEVVEIRDLSGELVHEVARRPMRDDTPIHGVPLGPRNFTWRNNTAEDEPAVLMWVEALDDGNPRTPADERDRIMLLAAPFDGEPRELMRMEERYSGIDWLDDGRHAMVRDFDRNRRWTRTWLVDVEADADDAEPRLVWDRSVHDRYGHPGSPVTTRDEETGQRLVVVHDNAIFLTGAGASPEGDRPFLDRMNLQTFDTERLWQCADSAYESVTTVIDPDGPVFMTRYETPLDPPNYFLHNLDADQRRQLTHFEDPFPQLRDVQQELVTYEREDGVTLSATLYLPPSYQEGQRLPLVVWAYPREFSDPSTAGQVAGSPYRFTMIGGSSHLFFLTQGYAIMDRAAMPVIGDAETMNDTFVEQIVAGAKAAIDYAVERGVADPNRVGVGGHSYGAFMTANLLAHSNLFNAGIARSGAFNRTLTPFGFQSERRTLWEAPDSYFAISPFMHADKITDPILLIHGMIDNNSGTYPMQSERMYHAIKGHGGTARLVMMPHESHGYRARESVLHVLAEMIEWFDRYVKEAETPTAEAHVR